MNNVRLWQHGLASMNPGAIHIGAHTTNPSLGTSMGALGALDAPAPSLWRPECPRILRIFCCFSG